MVCTFGISEENNGIRILNWNINYIERSARDKNKILYSKKKLSLFRNIQM